MIELFLNGPIIGHFFRSFSFCPRSAVVCPGLSLSPEEPGYLNGIVYQRLQVDDGRRRGKSQSSDE